MNNTSRIYNIIKENVSSFFQSILSPHKKKILNTLNHLQLDEGFVLPYKKGVNRNTMRQMAYTLLGSFKEYNLISGCYATVMTERGIYIKRTS